MLDERHAGSDVEGSCVVLHAGIRVGQLALVVSRGSRREGTGYIAGSASSLAALELLAVVLRLTVEFVHPVVARGP
jgi:hypothetical protein